MLSYALILDLYNTETADDAQRVKTDFDIMRTKYLKKKSSFEFKYGF